MPLVLLQPLPCCCTKFQYAREWNHYAFGMWRPSKNDWELRLDLLPPQFRLKANLATERLHISTLRRTVEAMGGELIMTGQFPDGAPIKLAEVTELDA